MASTGICFAQICARVTQRYRCLQPPVSMLYRRRGSRNPLRVAAVSARHLRRGQRNGSPIVRFPCCYAAHESKSVHRQLNAAHGISCRTGIFEGSNGIMCARVSRAVPLPILRHFTCCETYCMVCDPRKPTFLIAESGSLHDRCQDPFFVFYSYERKRPEYQDGGDPFSDWIWLIYRQGRCLSLSKSI